MNNSPSRLNGEAVSATKIVDISTVRRQRPYPAAPHAAVMTAEQRIRENEFRTCWLALQELRAARTANDAEAESQALGELEGIWLNTETASLRERCSRVLAEARRSNDLTG